jgi:hypothetical protein
MLLASLLSLHAPFTLGPLRLAAPESAGDCGGNSVSTHGIARRMVKPTAQSPRVIARRSLSAAMPLRLKIRESVNSNP